MIIQGSLVQKPAQLSPVSLSALPVSVQDWMEASGAEMMKRSRDCVPQVALLIARSWA